MRNDFDLDMGAFWQPCDLDSGARRKVRCEVFGIDFVHPAKIRQVGEEDGAFDDIGEREILVIEDGLDVIEDTLGLCLDVAQDQVARGGIKGNLSSAEKQVADAHGVVVGSDRGSGLGWFDDNLVRHCGGSLPLCPRGSSGRASHAAVLFKF